MKLIFKPFGILSGVLAGITSKKVFARVWRLFDDDAPPKPDERDATWSKLLLALMLEGAVLRVVRGAIDHATRRGFASLTGSWPGSKGREKTSR